MLRRLSEQDHYQILEVGHDARPEEIQAAYENAREIYGSESLVSASILTPEERRHVLRRVTEAYHTLIAEESRRLYDADLATKVEEAGSQEGAVGQPATSEKAYPRLVKGAGGNSAVHSRIQLGHKEEATGEFLRRARQSAGLDLRCIAEETKIGVTMLGYIEEERLDRLPAPVYLRNFVLQYARCLGLDEEKVARSYLARIRRLQSRADQS